MVGAGHWHDQWLGDMSGSRSGPQHTRLGNWQQSPGFEEHCCVLQVCTGVMLHGYPLVKKLCAGLQVRACSAP